ncbi:MAG: CoA transferase [Armatimonadetes bacterium]|nr:CoA transferase [Armatimonadota bacterium]
MSLPLEGIKVLDLTRLLPGPFCSLLLADFGAEVIKVEQPGPGDYIRWYPPLVQDTGGIFLLLNRNKKSLTLNLGTAKGKEIFYRLVREADVVLEGFRPGVAKKLGIDYETVKDLNPGVVYCSLSGYGQDGPYAAKPGHDINYLGYAGVLGITGRAGEAPAVPGVQIADIGGGALMAAIGILLALMARRQTGRGQFVDIAMLDGVISWLPTVAGSFFVDGIVPGPGETRLTGRYACYDVYRTKDGRYVSLGALELHFWEKLCRFLGKEEYVKWQFVDEKQDELRAFLREQFLLRSRDEWVEIFQQIDTCGGPVYNLAEVFADPQVLHRRMVFTLEHPRLGKIKQLGFPIKLSATPAQVRLAPPEPGEHTGEILTGLGYSPADLDALRKEGII